ncbi:hypothetical protein M758_9G165300 [Ceratodon purpureus]|nr:hypothetical protein M758_9G165300 [Ceratodon purpureus]
MASRGSLLALFLVGALLIIPRIHAQTLKGCYQSCTLDNQCEGQLACMSGKCNDDPGVGTHICSKAPPPPQAATCKPYGYLTAGTITSNECNPNDDPCCVTGHKYGRFACSPPITSPATTATMTVNSFAAGGDGGAPGACYGKYYPDSERVIAMSTGWFDNNSRCGKTIQISGNGKTTTAEVVDECDSQNGCDADHAYQQPCATNIVDASAAVWAALGVSTNDDRYGYMIVTWTQLN